MEITQCPICNSADVAVIYRVDRFPYIGFSVSEEEKEDILSQYSKEELFSPLKIMSCDICKHVFQAVRPNEKLINTIYSYYYNYPSPILTGLAQEREKAFLNFFFDNVYPSSKENKLNRVLEIACFDGFILNELSKKGFNVCGCDPSKGADIASSFGIKVYKECFDNRLFNQRDESFDIVILRHFIEHVDDPVNLIAQIKKVLNQGGLIIIETPNIEYCLENGSFAAFGFQHLQNFSICSLGETIKRTSLKLIDYNITPENLIAVISENGNSLSPESKLWEKHISEFRRNYEKNIKCLKELVKQYIEEDKKIVLWGAGSFLGHFFELYAVSEGCISYVVDTDKRRQGMCFIGKNLRIHSPERLLSDKADLIIITSMYVQEISEQISKMNIGSDVISLHPKIKYVRKNTYEKNINYSRASR